MSRAYTSKFLQVRSASAIARYQTSAQPSPAQTPWGGPDKVYRRLTGSWRIERMLDGHPFFHGTGHFIAAPHQTLFQEEGRLYTPNGKIPCAARDYIFKPTLNGIDIYLNEPHLPLFQSVYLNMLSDGHICGRASYTAGTDTYQSFYSFEPAGHFIIRHSVTGPNKGYIMLSTYRRM